MVLFKCFKVYKTLSVYLLSILSNNIIERIEDDAFLGCPDLNIL